MTRMAPLAPKRVWRTSESSGRGNVADLQGTCLEADGPGPERDRSPVAVRAKTASQPPRTGIARIPQSIPKRVLTKVPFASLHWRLRLTAFLSLGLTGCLVNTRITAAPADTSSVPSVIQAGFTLWTKGGGVDVILDSWQRGGAMEGNNKASLQADYFKRISRAVGNYKSFEFLKSDAVGRNSEILYLVINFERGAVYARFVVYHTEKDWVVQNMDFSTKPENIMPWLAFAADRAVE